MTSPVAGVDPHQDSFTVAICDSNGVEITWESFANSARGYVAAIEMLTTYRVPQVGVEGSASWGAHVAIALVAAGFDAREVTATTIGPTTPIASPRQNRSGRRRVGCQGIACGALAWPGAGL
jgi:hypothetical protein